MHNWVLWRPNPVLEEFVDTIEDKLRQIHGGGDAVNNNKPFTAIDLGCGSGRDMVFLARRRSRRPWTVTGIDHLPKVKNEKVFFFFRWQTRTRNPQ